MTEDLKYAEFQKALIDLLASGLPEETIIATIKSDARFDSYRDYVDQFDPDMVAVACELMGKWARRKVD
ncbi:hypothetical protein KBI23_14685 [bacterium]|nr:hypothetical protein [bacterium]MBP9808007.1 hypothetical protein [bacterium]